MGQAGFGLLSITKYEEIWNSGSKVNNLDLDKQPQLFNSNQVAYNKMMNLFLKCYTYTEFNTNHIWYIIIPNLLCNSPTWECYKQRTIHVLPHWGRVMHICAANLAIIASDNGLSPGRHQAIIWTNVGILLYYTLRNKLQLNFNRNSSTFIEENAFETAVREVASILSWPQCVMVY